MSSGTNESTGTPGRVILGFDTATPDTAVAISGEGEAAERAIGPREDGRPVHNSALLPAIEELVDVAGGWDAVGLIAVGVGPGSFTGLRIGIATARGLAQTRGIAIAAVPSLSALAAGIAATPAAAGRTPLAVIDARRGEVFAALAPGTERAEPSEPVVCPPEELAARIGPEALGSAIAGGDGAVRFRPEFEAAGALVLPGGDAANHLSARWICELGAGIEPVAPELIRPMYLRRPDAERWRERDGRN
ncbi:MAG: tRNA (adenosine(37)-N6)-threonylcarbamoyltransferase complex dimerization subunit type 1 TsaB [Solirubrobacterales bacterium]